VRIFFGRKKKHMKNIQLNITAKKEVNLGGNEYKVIEVNVSDPAENSFAVVTPVKIK
jgi:hypothetical protein